MQDFVHQQYGCSVQVMEGDNQWLCEELGKKVDALKGRKA